MSDTQQPKRLPGGQPAPAQRGRSHSLERKTASEERTGDPSPPPRNRYASIWRERKTENANNPSFQRYDYLRALAYFNFSWKTCPSPKCRANRRCTGGPRGTFRRHGMPMCEVVAQTPAEPMRKHLA